MSRRGQRGNLRHGLWEDTPTGPKPGENHPNPLTVRCPWNPCHAAPWQQCVGPHQRPRTQPHPGRIDAANHPQEPPNAQPADPRS